MNININIKHNKYWYNINIINKYNKVTERLWTTASVRSILIYAVLEIGAYFAKTPLKFIESTERRTHHINDSLELSY